MKLFRSLKTRSKNFCIKFWAKLNSPLSVPKVFLGFFLVISLMNGCGQAGWVGYYEMQNPAVYEKPSAPMRHGYNYALLLLKSERIHLNLPARCSSLRFAGIITPFTPPIPLFWFRSWAWGESDCNYFVAFAPSNLKIYLKHKNQIYDSMRQARPYDDNLEIIRYTFPVRAKNIDSGSIIIEKDDQTIEVPFEYKYTKFWY
jgi:hypothetical protein